VPVITFDVGYSQTASSSTPGDITLNGTEVRTASGRLDNVGDVVFADGFISIPGYVLTIECTRTTATTMRVRLIFSGFDSLYLQYYCQLIERTVDNVPLNLA